MSRPKITTLDKAALDGLTTQDFFPGRLDKEENTTDRISLIASETQRLFKHSRDTPPTKEAYPTLYHELPTLWALIEEGKFRYWNEREQTMLNKMIELQLNVTTRHMTDVDAEKQAGLVLADRFLVPVAGKIPDGSGMNVDSASKKTKDKDDDSRNVRD